MAFALQRQHQFLLLLRGNPAEDRIAVAGVIQVFFGFQGGGVHIPVPPGNAGTAGNHGNGDGVIAGDDADIHILLPEIAKGFIHCGAQLVRQDTDAADGFEGRQGFGRNQSLAFHQDQDPFAFRGVLFHPLAEFRGIAVAEDEFRRAENQHGAVIEGGGGFFALRGEGEHVPGLFIGRRDLCPQSVQRGAVLVKDAQQPGKGLFCFLPGAFHAFHGFQFHGAGGQGAGFIQAQHVHPGQGFNTGKLLHQGVAPAQLDHTDGHGHTGQQDQAFRNHADHGCHRRGNGLRNGNMTEQ